MAVWLRSAFRFRRQWESSGFLKSNSLLIPPATTSSSPNNNNATHKRSWMAFKRSSEEMDLLYQEIVRATDSQLQIQMFWLLCKDGSGSFEIFFLSQPTLPFCQQRLLERLCGRRRVLPPGSGVLAWQAPVACLAFSSVHQAHAVSAASPAQLCSTRWPGASPALL